MANSKFDSMKSLMSKLYGKSFHKYFKNVLIFYDAKNEFNKVISRANA